MGISFRRSIPLGKHVRLNLSRSGVSVSLTDGRTTINSRGRITERIGRGLSWRGRL